MLNIWYNAAMLSIEAQRVIGLRMMKFAMGGRGARTEATLMVSEKMTATVAAATTLASGGSGEKVLKQTRKRVRANSRRLSRK